MNNKQKTSSKNILSKSEDFIALEEYPYDNENSMKKNINFQKFFTFRKKIEIILVDDQVFNLINLVSIFKNLRNTKYHEAYNGELAL